MNPKQEERGITQSVNLRMTRLLMLFMVVMAIVVSSISYWALQATYLRMYNEKAQDLVRSLAAGLDGEQLLRYVETGETDADYDAIYQTLCSTKSSFRGVTYLYVYRPMEDHFIYIVEGMREDDDPADICHLGDTFDYQALGFNYMLPDAKAGRASTGLIQEQNEGYDRCIFAWAPVFASDGSTAAMVEADCYLSEVRSVVNAFAIPIVATMLGCVALVVILMMQAMRSTVTRPLARLTAFVNSYDHGDAEGQLPEFKFDDEMRYMAVSFQEMTVRIQKYIDDLTRVTAEKERIGAELNVATQIQADMLPRIFPPFPDRREFDLFASMDPAKEVGGDFYDFFLLDNDHLAVVMADVSGKGVPAALFMVIAKTMLKNRAHGGGSPGEILRDVNNQLCEGNDADLFVTVWLGILTISTGKLISASAGHEYPAFYRAASGVFALEKDKHGPPLASIEGLRFRETETVMAHGDALFLYTDGVTEATSSDVELFGEARTLEALNAFAHASSQEILKGVREKIDAFVGSAPQFDDITMLCLRYL